MDFKQFLLEAIRPSIDYNHDYFEDLDISKTASDAEIKKAYQRLSMKYHPDKNIGKDTTEKFKEIKLFV